MVYNLKISEWARHFCVSPSTIQRWQRMGAPLDDAAAMDLFRMRLRSRTGVSKNNRRTSAAFYPEEPELSKVELDHWWLTVAKPIWEAHKAAKAQSRTS